MGLNLIQKGMWMVKRSWPIPVLTISLVLFSCASQPKRVVAQDREYPKKEGVESDLNAEDWDWKIYKDVTGQTIRFLKTSDGKIYYIPRLEMTNFLIQFGNDDDFSPVKGGGLDQYAEVSFHLSLTPKSNQEFKLLQKHFPKMINTFEAGFSTLELTAPLMKPKIFPHDALQKRIELKISSQSGTLIRNSAVGPMADFGGIHTKLTYVIPIGKKEKKFKEIDNPMVGKSERIIHSNRTRRRFYSPYSLEQVKKLLALQSKFRDTPKDRTKRTRLLKESYELILSHPTELELRVMNYFKLDKDTAATMLMDYAKRIKEIGVGDFPPTFTNGTLWGLAHRLYMAAKVLPDFPIENYPEKEVEDLYKVVIQGHKKFKTEYWKTDLSIKEESGKMKEVKIPLTLRKVEGSGKFKSSPMSSLPKSSLDPARYLDKLKSKK